MAEVTLEIDGREVKAQTGMTILQAARSIGIEIPALCYDDRLEPYGGCRVCSVEIGKAPKTRIVASCVYPVENGLVVNTKSERVIRARRVLTELLLTRAPGAKVLKDLAAEYQADPERFEKDATFCIVCGLCVRYCAEVKKANAVSFVSRGVLREIMFVPEIASKTCPPCQECFEICPTNVARSNFLLAQALTFSGDKEKA
jgi:bidirectional [NiFe] hydrogenase diaphorase subunit